MSRSPSLAGCWLRVVRANGYIQEAHGLITGYARKCEERIAASYDSDIRSFTRFEIPDTPVFLPLIISDAIHNLRAALDYLAFELAFKDSGTIQNGTQFPIVDMQAGFDSIVDRYLKGVSQSHRDMIESVQPYRGGHGLETLRDISNPDKHRELTVINQPDNLKINRFTHSGIGSGKRLPTGETIQIDDDQCFSISLPDRDAMIPGVLHYVEASVKDTINLFNSEF